GWSGAAVATLGIFMPAFLLVAASGPFVSSLRESRLVASLLDGVTVGALALMAVVTWQLGRVAVVDVTTAVLAAGSVLLLLRFRMSSTWLIAAGAGLGVILGMAACGAPARPPRGPRAGVVLPAPRVAGTPYALGAGDRLVGVCAQCDRPPAALGLPRVGGYLAPSVEAVLALRPALVIVVPSPG